MIIVQRRSKVSGFLHYNSMKRIITILVALSAVLSMNAQGRHEIEVLMGGPVSGIFFNECSSYAKYDYYYSSGNTLKDLYEDVKYRDSFIGMGLVYSYEVKSWLKLGIDATASIEEVTTRKGLAYKEDANNLYSQGVSHFTVMPMARIRYKDGYKAEAYGRIAAGMEFITNWGDEEQKQFAWEVVPFGLCFGKKDLHFIFEMGLGTAYMARFGISYEF